MVNIIWFVCLAVLVAISISIHRYEGKLFQYIIEKLNTQEKAIKILRELYRDLTDDRK